MGIVEVITAPRSPWQNAYVERVIGSIRRECLDHLVIFNERHLRRVFTSYVDYYHRTRTHLSLDKDCPEQRPIQVPKVGKIIAIPQVGGMHHRYQRLAAQLLAHTVDAAAATGATSSTHFLIETFPADSAGSSDRFRSQLPSGATTPNEFRSRVCSNFRSDRIFGANTLKCESNSDGRSIPIQMEFFVWAGLAELFHHLFARNFHPLRGPSGASLVASRGGSQTEVP
jgi:hypothetical protein